MIEELLVEELRDLLSAEGQLVKVPGAVANYVFQISKFERQNSVALYAFGTGGTMGGNWSFADDPAAGMQDAMTMSLMHVLSQTYLLPVWRLHEAFSIDTRLVERYRPALAGISVEQLQVVVKRLLFLNGCEVDRSRMEFTATDLPIVIAELRNRGIDERAPEALIKLAARLWSKDLDFVQAAGRVAAYNEIFLRPQATPVAREFGPADFGWSPASRIMLVDISRIADEKLRAEILGVVSRWAGTDRVRKHSKEALIAIRLVGDSSGLSMALRARHLPLAYVWTTDSRHQDYLVLARKETQPSERQESH